MFLWRAGFGLTTMASALNVLYDVMSVRRGAKPADMLVRPAEWPVLMLVNVALARPSGSG